MKYRKMIILTLTLLLLTSLCCTSTLAAGGDVAGAVQQTWTEAAKQIKAVGDKLYPKLIKDIYMGKGTYNQDLAPRSVLLEFGTHTLSKERVLRSTGPMAEVCYKALFGGVTGSAGASDVSGSKSAENVPADQSNKGSGAAVWIILALLLGVGLFAFLSTGGRGGFSKWKDSLGEMTGGFFGGRRRDK